MQELEEQIRQTLRTAEEEVPSRVWDAVAARLDAAAPKPVAVPLWRRVALYAVPAAAAVALGVFLASPRTRPASAPAFDRVIAQAVPELTTPALTAPRPIVLSDRIPSELPASSAAEFPAASPEELPSSESNTSSTAAPRSKPASAPDAAGAADDQAALNALALAAERGSASGRLSFSVGGNVQTNGNPSASRPRPMRASAQPQTGISEGTNRYYGIPVTFGLGVQYRFAPKWSVATGLTYTNLSRSFAGRYSEIADGREVLSLEGDIDNVQHYLGIPLDVRYHLLESRSIRCYTFLGGSVERCLADKYRIRTVEDYYWNKPVRGVQFSAAAGLGVEFVLTPHLAVYADPSLRYWFECGQSKSIRTQQPLMAALELGLRFGW